jgi:hypothetical protein
MVNFTAQDFLSKAQSVTVIINGVEFIAHPKEFSTGSFGWYLTSKLHLPVGDQKVNCQIGMNMTIIGSKKNNDKK